MNKTVCLFSDPDRDAEDYREDIRLSFGKTVDLPELFGFTLETSELQ